MIDRVAVTVKKLNSGTGEPTKAQNGSAVDDDATPPPAADLSRAVMSSTADDPEANLFLSLGGEFPTVGPFVQNFSFGFDVDSSAATGAVLPEFGATGFDTFLDVSVRRTSADDAPAVTQASLRDAVTGAIIGDGDARVGVGTDFDTGPRGEDSEPAESQLSIDFLKSDAGFGGPLVGVGAIAFNVSGDIVDTLVMNFDLEGWKLQPALDIGLGMPRPRQSVPFDVAGLTPGSLFDLFLNDEFLMSATLDAQGGLQARSTCRSSAREPISSRRRTRPGTMPSTS